MKAAENIQTPSGSGPSTHPLVDARALIERQLAYESRGRGVAAGLIGVLSLALAHYPAMAHGHLKHLEGWSGGALIFLAAVLAILLLSTSSLVFGKPVLSRRTLAVFLVVDLAAVLGFLLVTAQPEPWGGWPDLSWKCLVAGTVHSVALLLFLYALRRYLRRSLSALLLAGTLVGATAIVTLHYHCPHQGFFHLLIHHGGVLIPSLALAAWLLSPSRDDDPDASPQP